MRRGYRWALLPWVLATLSSRAATDPLDTSLRRCGAQTDQVQRLACFDALVAALPKVEADRFGMTAEIANKRDPLAERQAQSDILPATITAVGAGGHGELIFTLDNQQVWIQTQAEPGKHFAVGEAVHIERGAMGSLWLAASKGRMTKVRRIS
jgi:hypothetical protein